MRFWRSRNRSAEAGNRTRKPRRARRALTRYGPAILLVITAIISIERFGTSLPHAPALQAGDPAIGRAYREQAHDLPVRGEGVVIRLLPDDRRGTPHQRFILRLPSGQTLLIAHNIRIGARLAPLHVGDRVRFQGIYEWNPQGGVIHWTHRDPEGRHVSGWLINDGPQAR